MNFNQKTLEFSKSRLEHMIADSDGIAYEVWRRRRVDQEFAKLVFLGCVCVDRKEWENPYIYGERGVVYRDDEK